MSLAWLKQNLFPTVRSRVGAPNSRTRPRSPGDSLTLDLSTESDITISTDLEKNSDLEAQTTLSAPTESVPEYDTGLADKKAGHFKPSTRVVQDTILGLSDGMTVPFALTAGLSALGNTRLVIIGGVAELCAGAISMGLGAYLAGRTEAIAYFAKLLETKNMVQNDSKRTGEILRGCLRSYVPIAPTGDQITTSIMTSEDFTVAFLMYFSCQAIRPDGIQPTKSALAMGLGYAFGGLLPLIPYFAVPKDQVLTALWWSIGVMVLALLIFGYGKTGVTSGWGGRQNVLRCVRGAIEMLVIGGLAAGAAVGITRGINSAFD